MKKKASLRPEKSRPEKIRTRAVASRRIDRMSRAQALASIPMLLDERPFHPDALYLIHLFHLHPEELAEAGLSYELIMALENKASFL